MKNAAISLRHVRACTQLSLLHFDLYTIILHLLHRFVARIRVRSKVMQLVQKLREGNSQILSLPLPVACAGVEVDKLCIGAWSWNDR